jgi:aryl-alcohol dehydrogenase-like predicted oxidoreductase
VNLVDTADVYSEGTAEEMLGQAIRDLGLPREDLVVATKARGQMGPAQTVRASRASTS